MLRRIRASSSSKYGKLIGVRESSTKRSKTSPMQDREAILRLAGKYKGHVCRSPLSRHDF